MSWILTRLISGKGVSVLIGMIALSWFGMWLAIKGKNIQISNRDKTIAKNLKVISNYKESQTTNLSTIQELQVANQQCAQSRELNEQNASEQTRLQNGRIAEYENKYAELKKKLPKMGCGYTVTIDPDILDGLYQNRIHNPD